MTKSHLKILIIAGITLVCEVASLFLAASAESKRAQLVAFSLFFPIPSIIGNTSEWLQWLAVVGYLAQFPAYGFIIGKAWMAGRFTKAAFFVACLHISTAAVAFCVMLWILK